MKSYFFVVSLPLGGSPDILLVFIFMQTKIAFKPV